MNILIIDVFAMSPSFATDDAIGDIATATSIPCALKLFMRRTFDLIIVSCSPAQLDIVELISTLRALEVLGKRSPSRIIGSIPDGEQKLSSLLLYYGADFCIYQPLSLEKIQTAITVGDF